MIQPYHHVYDFVFRGLLTEQALDQAGRRSRKLDELADIDIAKALAIDLLDDEFVKEAKRMAVVYSAIAAFENSVRGLISKILLENAGEKWWQQCVSQRIRGKADNKMRDEEKVRWHTRRGADPITYTEMGHLADIIRNNWKYFEPYINSIEWASNIFEIVERSRNVIMHSGVLEKEDIQRLGIYIRDWIKQVGA